jgi:hypothetical protein
MISHAGDVDRFLQQLLVVLGIADAKACGKSHLSLPGQRRLQLLQCHINSCWD